MCSIQQHQAFDKYNNKMANETVIWMSSQSNIVKVTSFSNCLKDSRLGSNLEYTSCIAWSSLRWLPTPSLYWNLGLR